MKRPKLYRTYLKPRAGMYPEQFELLQKGDIIRGAKPKSKYRIIQKVIQREGYTYMIELVKLHPSWTRGNTTLYCASDAVNFLPIRVADERIWDMTREGILGARRKAMAKHNAGLIKFYEQRAKTLKTQLP